MEDVSGEHRRMKLPASNILTYQIGKFEWIIFEIKQIGRVELPSSISNKPSGEVAHLAKEQRVRARSSVSQPHVRLEDGGARRERNCNG